MKKAGFAIIILLIVAMFAACSDVRKLSFDQDEIVAAPDTTFMPKLNIRPRKADYTLTVANQTIAVVTENGIKTLKEGRTTITATAGELTATATLIVSKDISPNKDIVGRITYRTLTFIVDNAILHSMEIEDKIAPGYPNISGKAGYNIDGWYTSSKMEKKFNFDIPLEKDTIVYGKYQLLPATFVYEIKNGAATVTGLAYPLNPYEEIVFPTVTPLDVPVTGIKPGLFKGNTTLKKITIPKEYTAIGDETFSGCTALEEVIFEEGSNLTRIGVKSFEGCSKLKTFVIPPAVTGIEAGAFYNCSQLNITSLPEGVDNIAQYAFAGTGITSVNLEHVTTLLEGAFDGCTKLETVTNTQNLVRVYKFAFRNVKAAVTGTDTNKGIQTVGTIVVGITSNTVKTALDMSSVTLIADAAFTGANQELVLFLSGNPVNIKLQATNVFHDKIEIVVENSYYENTRISSVWRPYLPWLCRRKEEGQFTLLHHYNSAKNPQNWYSLLKYTEKSDGTAPETVDLSTLNYPVTKIKSGAFTQLNKLKILKISDDVTEIENYAVNGNPALLAVFIGRQSAPTLNGTFSIAKGNNGNGALKIYVPNDKVVYYKSQWPSLTSVILSQDIVDENGLCIEVLSIGYAVVRQYIGSGKNVVIPEKIAKDGTKYTVCKIEEYAFASNAAIESITISASVDEIKAYAFAHNEYLKTVEFLGTNSNLVIRTPFISTVSVLENIYIPTGSTEFYSQALGTGNQALVTKLTERE